MPCDQRGCRGFPRVQQKGRQCNIFAPRAQHIRCADIPGADFADVALAGRAREQQAKRRRAEDVASGKNGGNKKRGQSHDVVLRPARVKDNLAGNDCDYGFALQAPPVERRVLRAGQQLIGITDPWRAGINQNQICRRTLGYPPAVQTEQAGRVCRQGAKKRHQVQLLIGDQRQAGRQQDFQTDSARGGLVKGQALFTGPARVMSGHDNINRAVIDAVNKVR